MSNFTPSNLHRDGMTAADHRAAALADRRRSAESFERCDTDGFLSQWAMDTTARAHECHASLIEEGGVITTTAVFDAETGEVASTHQGWGQYGEFWVLRDAAAAKLGKRFWSPSNAAKGTTRRRNDERKGFRLGNIEVAGVVGFGGGGRACIVPDIDAMRADEYKIVDTDCDYRYGETFDR